MVTEPAVADGVAEAVIASTEASRQPPSYTEVRVRNEEKKAALDDLLQQLYELDDGPQFPDISASSTGPEEKSVEEEEVVAKTVKGGQELESAVPAFLLEEIEREEALTAASSPVHPSESLGVDSAASDSVTEAGTGIEGRLSSYHVYGYSLHSLNLSCPAFFIHRNPIIWRW